jgi:protein subunit release factor A
MKQIDDMINNVLDEIMSKSARMKRSRMMKTKGKQIARKRKIAMKRRATPDKLKSRALKKARDIITKKILKDRKKSELSMAAKEALEKKLNKKKAVIKRIAKKLLPKVRGAEAERLKKRGDNA